MEFTTSEDLDTLTHCLKASTPKYLQAQITATPLTKKRTSSSAGEWATTTSWALAKKITALSRNRCTPRCFSSAKSELLAQAASTSLC